jgi:hypothetical protein
VGRRKRAPKLKLIMRMTSHSSESFNVKDMQWPGDYQCCSCSRNIYGIHTRPNEQIKIGQNLCLILHLNKTWEILSRSKLEKLLILRSGI